MKIALRFNFFILCAATAAAAAIHPVAELSPTKDEYASSPADVDAIHRELMGKCKHDFVCPEHSERKRGLNW